MELVEEFKEVLIKTAKELKGSTMTWKGKHPVVELVTSIYQTGVKLTKEAILKSLLFASSQTNAVSYHS